MPDFQYNIVSHAALFFRTAIGSSTQLYKRQKSCAAIPISPRTPQIASKRHKTTERLLKHSKMAQEAYKKAQETPTTPPYEPWKAQILELHRGPVAPNSFGTSWGSPGALSGLSQGSPGAILGSAGVLTRLCWGAMVEALYPRGHLGLEFFSKTNAQGKIK